MGLEDQEVSSIAEELIEKKPPVNTFRAVRQFERFLMGVNPAFRIDAPREDQMRTPASPDLCFHEEV